MVSKLGTGLKYKTYWRIVKGDKEYSHGLKKLTQYWTKDDRIAQAALWWKDIRSKQLFWQKQKLLDRFNTSPAVLRRLRPWTPWKIDIVRDGCSRYGAALTPVAIRSDRKTYNITLEQILSNDHEVDLAIGHEQAWIESYKFHTCPLKRYIYISCFSYENRNSAKLSNI